MIRYESGLDAHIARARDNVTLARSAVAEARRSISAGRTSASVEAQTQASTRLMAAERRLALMEWERDLDEMAHRLQWKPFDPDDALWKLTHRTIGGDICDECLTAGSLIRRGQTPPASWSPACGEPLNDYESIPGGPAPAA